MKDADGKTVNVPGRFKECRAVGWYIEEYGRAQISVNFTNYKVTSIHEVFDAACDEAARRGLRVTGSELVGLIPLEAILAEFADELSSDSPAPGGGSVAALLGSLSAALSSMVAALTWSKAGLEAVRPAMKEIGVDGQGLKDWFLDAVDRDTDAFNAVLAAMRLPKKTDEDARARLAAVEKANQRAARVPLEVVERSVRALELSLAVARDGNPNSVSDAGVAGACALAAAEGAALNVRINVPNLTDAEVAGELLADQERLVARARELAAEVRDTVDRVLAHPGK